MNEITKVDNLEAINGIRLMITDKHKKVSRIKTPKPYIKKKMGMEYVEYNYMREIADREFPGWSWLVKKTEIAGSEAYIVHGRLKWYDEGIWREGDVTAAHRIQKKRGTNEFVDIGNDVKAANTDAIKKAFNMFMNIADDVYRNQVEETKLSDEQKSEILKVAKKISTEKFDQITTLIEEGDIYGGNFNSSLAKLERVANAQD
jgi:restriction endonuclease Mrr